MEENFEEYLKKLSDKKLQRIILDKKGCTKEFRMAAAIELNKRNPDFDSDGYIVEIKQSINDSKTSNNTSWGSNQDKYPALSSISVAFKILAWVNIIASLVGIGLIASMELEMGIPIIVAISFYAFFSTIILFAVSEIIKLFIDIEKNTRMRDD
jgi:hypothetical protein